MAVIKDIIVIPSFEPDIKLSLYVKEIRAYGFTDIIIVDDGSGEEYQLIFQELQKSGCIILRHINNLGKGCALKTGFQYIKKNFEYFSCVVTADSDGQHAPEDVYHLAEKSKKHPDALILGVRDFHVSGIPVKSLMGNRFSSFVFFALYGKHLPDTQTGLRAFGPSLLDFVLGVQGSRFEYEMQMLISCVQSSITILTTPIQIIYINANERTHFKPFGDSFKIIIIIFSNFFRFIFSSIVSAAFDLGIAWFLLDLFRATLQQQDYLRILLATSLARVVSIAINYLINKNFVFQRRDSVSKSLWRYLILCVFIILLSTTGVYMLAALLFIQDKVGKIICDVLLFPLSYYLQQRWVFGKRSGDFDEK